MPKGDQLSPVAAIRSLYRLLDNSERRRTRLAVVVAGMLSLLDLAALALLVPLTQVLSDPETASAQVLWLQERLGIADADTLVLVLGVGVIGLFIMRSVASVLYQWWVSGLVFSIDASIAGRLIRSYLGAPYSFHLAHPSAELVRNVKDNTRLAIGSGFNNVLQLVAELFVLLAVALLLTIVNPAVTASLALYFVLMIALYQRVVRPYIDRAADRNHRLMRQQYSSLLHSFGGTKEIYAGNRQRVFADDLEQLRRRAAHEARKLSVFGNAPRYYLEVALMIGLGIAAGVLFAISPPDARLATMAVFIGAGFRTLPSLGKLMQVANAVRTQLPALTNVIQDLGRFHLPQAPTAPLQLSASDPVVEFRDVTFAYLAEQPVVRGLTFSVERGSSLGIVGESGAGKTTTLDLLLGLYDPDEGELMVGGLDIRSVAPEWRENIGYVPQEVFLVDGTIGENIAFGVPRQQIDDDRIAQAIERAELAPFVTTLPCGVDTQVGERGVRLSGGQRQRIGLARALYRQPQVLVLDEATSSLDLETEARITDTVHHLGDDLTTIVVAHRISTVRHCDRICLLDEGRIVGEGTFEALCESSARFRKLAVLAGMSEPEPERVA